MSERIPFRFSATQEHELEFDPKHLRFFCRCDTRVHPEECPFPEVKCRRKARELGGDS